MQTTTTHDDATGGAGVMTPPREAEEVSKQSPQNSLTDPSNESWTKRITQQNMIADDAMVVDIGIMRFMCFTRDSLKVVGDNTPTQTTKEAPIDCVKEPVDIKDIYVRSPPASPIVLSQGSAFNPKTSGTTATTAVATTNEQQNEAVAARLAMIDIPLGRDFNRHRLVPSAHRGGNGDDEDDDDDDDDDDVELNLPPLYHISAKSPASRNGKSRPPSVTSTLTPNSEPDGLSLGPFSQVCSYQPAEENPSEQLGNAATLANCHNSIEQNLVPATCLQVDRSSFMPTAQPGSLEHIFCFSDAKGIFSHTKESSERLLTCAGNNDGENRIATAAVCSSLYDASLWPTPIKEAVESGNDVSQEAESSQGTQSNNVLETSQHQIESRQDSHPDRATWPDDGREIPEDTTGRSQRDPPASEPEFMVASLKPTTHTRSNSNSDLYPVSRVSPTIPVTEMLADTHTQVEAEEEDEQQDIDMRKEYYRERRLLYLESHVRLNSSSETGASHEDAELENQLTISFDDQPFDCRLLHQQHQRNGPTSSVSYHQRTLMPSNQQEPFQSQPRRSVSCHQRSVVRPSPDECDRSMASHLHDTYVKRKQMGALRAQGAQNKNTAGGWQVGVPAAEAAASFRRTTTRAGSPDVMENSSSGGDRSRRANRLHYLKTVKGIKKNGSSSPPPLTTLTGHTLLPPSATRGGGGGARSGNYPTRDLSVSSSDDFHRRMKTLQGLAPTFRHSSPKEAASTTTK